MKKQNINGAPDTAAIQANRKAALPKKPPRPSISNQVSRGKKSTLKK